VFVSGLKRSLTDVLFSAKPKDLPSALALAEEDPHQLKFVIQAAVTAGLAEQAAANKVLLDKVNSMSQQLAAAHITPPEVQAYAPIEIRNDIRCDEPLDAVKCFPEFAGAHESYVS